MVAAARAGATMAAIIVVFGDRHSGTSGHVLRSWRGFVWRCRALRGVVPLAFMGRGFSRFLRRRRIRGTHPQLGGDSFRSHSIIGTLVGRDFPSVLWTAP
jgi:hypothetical protein